MTSHTGRLYSLALALLAFFLAWVVIASRPWGAARVDPRLRVLAAREARLKHDGALVNRLVAQRFATYRAELRLRQARLASTRTAGGASGGVRVVNLPPLTVTRTS